jgi:hypothetical protein
MRNGTIWGVFAEKLALCDACLVVSVVVFTGRVEEFLVVIVASVIVFGKFYMKIWDPAQLPVDVSLHG